MSILAKNVRESPNEDSVSELAISMKIFNSESWKKHLTWRNLSLHGRLPSVASPAVCCLLSLCFDAGGSKHIPAVFSLLNSTGGFRKINLPVSFLHWSCFYPLYPLEPLHEVHYHPFSAGDLLSRSVGTEPHLGSSSKTRSDMWGTATGQQRILLGLTQGRRQAEGGNSIGKPLPDIKPAALSILQVSRFHLWSMYLLTSDCPLIPRDTWWMRQICDSLNIYTFGDLNINSKD